MLQVITNRERIKLEKAPIGRKEIFVKENNPFLYYKGLINNLKLRCLRIDL